MATRIIKQPNGKYCLFSSIVDNVTDYDLEPSDIILVLLEEEKKHIEEFVQTKINSDINGANGDYQDMLSLIETIHGEKEKLKVESLLK